jgi:undecaprenyl-diphosphatase
MNYLDAVVLGVVEGLTEFLPVSSTGHLNIASNLMQTPDTPYMKTFKVVIQFGAILAVVVLYWRSLLVNWRVMLRVAVAFVPTAILGALLYERIRMYLDDVVVTLWALLIGGNVLVFFELFHGEKKDAVDGMEKIAWWQAFLIGVSQSLAFIPGVSRSAATVLGGMAVGLKRRTVVEFSFLLAVPTIAAASGRSLIKDGELVKMTTEEMVFLAIGLVVSFVVAYATIRLFLRFVQTHTFIWFGVYRIVAAGVVWYILFGRNTGSPG